MMKFSLDERILYFFFCISWTTCGHFERFAIISVFVVWLPAGKGTS